MKYAVVENGSNQLLVEPGDRVLVDEHDLKKGDSYKWEKVMFLRDDEKTEIGTPYLKKVKVKGEVNGMVKGPKVINYKKKRRKGYSRKVGHRQKYTEVTVKEIG